MKTLTWLLIALPLLASDPQDSAVRVEVKKDGRIFGGSGTVINLGKQTLVLTNEHVVREADSVSVVKDGRYIKAELLAANPSVDLALLKVKEKMAGASLANEEPAVGSEVRTFGHPDWKLTPKVGKALGNVDNARQRGMRVWYSTIHPEPGDSGSGVFDREGRLVAVNWGGYTDACCVSLADVKRFLKDHAKE